MERTCPMLPHWLREEIRLFSPESARRLVGREGLVLLAQDLEAAQAVIHGWEPDPAHAEVAARAAAVLGDPERFASAVLAAAALRRFLG